MKRTITVTFDIDTDDYDDDDFPHGGSAREIKGGSSCHSNPLL